VTKFLPSFDLANLTPSLNVTNLRPSFDATKFLAFSHGGQSGLLEGLDFSGDQVSASLVASVSAESRGLAMEAVSWVDGLSDHDTRTLLLKSGAVLIGLAMAVNAYCEMGLDAAVWPLVWAVYYILDLANTRLDKTRA
jgi:hypothetical protein